MGDMIPIAGMFTGLIITVAAIWGTVQVIHGPLGQAVARRIQGRSADPDLRAEVAELREQVEAVRQQLEETHERLDFTERVLSQRPPNARIAGGDGNV
jgi:hypothetical protein